MASLWWGSLTALGFVVVPMLFANLPSPAIAGAMAARLFTAQTWIGVVCTMIMLVASNPKDREAQTVLVPDATKLIAAGLLLALLVEFAVAPRIVAARSDASSLRLWHGLGSAMYLAQWFCASISLWRFSRPYCPT